MINGLHLLMFSADPAADRTFLADLLGWPSVSDPVSTAQAGEEWLIFGTPPTELGVHPARDAEGSTAPDFPRCELYLMCDDLDATAAELRQRGVEVSEPVTRSYGRGGEIMLPSGALLGLYRPSHPVAYDLEP